MTRRVPLERAALNLALAAVSAGAGFLAHASKSGTDVAVMRADLTNLAERFARIEAKQDRTLEALAARGLVAAPAMRAASRPVARRGLYSLIIARAAR